MWSRIVSFIMGFVLLFCNLFGIEVTDEIVAETFTNYIYNNVSYGEHERQKLDLYIPKGGEAEKGLILMIHGGAWISGDKGGYKKEMKNWAKEGFATAAINYRYLSYEITFDDLLDDIESALGFIKQKGIERGKDINKVLLTGYSAGGHLSMLYAYARKDTSPIEPVAVVDYCGPTDLVDPAFYDETANEEKKYVFKLMASLAYGEELTLENAYLAHDVLKKASPICYVDENTVPTVINHGHKDELVPYTNALSLEEKFIEFGVKYDFVFYPNSGHGLENDTENREKSEELFEKYVNEYLK